MSWDGSGNVVRTNGTNTGTTVWQDDRDDGVSIRADRHDTHDEDLANAIENTVALDGQNTTVTDNALLRYSTGSDNKFVGVAVGTDTLVGRKSGDIETYDVGPAAAAIPTNEDVADNLASVPSIPDSGTDAYTGGAGRALATGEVARVDFGSSSTTTTPTWDNTDGTDGALTITTRDGSALWDGALSGIHTVEKAASSWLVLDPIPQIPESTDLLDEDDMASDSDAAVPTQQSVKAYTDTQVATRARIATGTYTGDGTTSQSITGVGFQPTFVKITRQETTGGNSTSIIETTDVINDDITGGAAAEHTGGGAHAIVADRIVSLDADGFTVGDAGSDQNPNVSGSVYNYMAIG